MTHVLTDHQAIREWAIARGGRPVVMSTPTPTGGSNEVLRLNFAQPGARLDALDDNQASATEGMERVDWGEWLAKLDAAGLAVEVGEEREGSLDSTHRIVKR